MGDTELLSSLNAMRLSMSEERYYLTFFVTCTDATKNFQQLLQVMINSAESVENVEGEDRANKLVDRTTRKQLTIKIFEAESTKHYRTASERLSYQDLNNEEKLSQLCELLTASYGMPVLFIIDELDRMDTTSGLASYLKAVSSEDLKFVLVGIANHVSELLGDHQSLERRLLPVRVPLMKTQELTSVIEKAVLHLENAGHRVRFTHRALEQLIKISAGFPWFIHVLGQECLVEADTRGRDVITEMDVTRAREAIVKNRFAQQFSDIYQVAVRDSMRREMALRAFAHWTQPDIPVGEVYRVLEKMDVKGGSTYRGQLCEERYGSILFVPQMQARGLIRFRNEMFKAYIRMRPSIYEGVAAQVAEAWEN